MLVLSSLLDAQVAPLLLKGKVGIIPTDTIYGLAVCAGDVYGVERLSELKKGEISYKPGTVVAANVEQLVALGIDQTVVRSVAHLWPNPISVELPLDETLAYLYQDGPHRAFRVVADAGLVKLLEKTGPLLTSSVNLHGQPPATNLNDAQAYFGDQVDFYVDGGDLGDRPPSALVRVSGGRIEILRQGAITINKKGQIV